MPESRTPPLQPLDALWQARTILWIVLAGEVLALVLALGPGAGGDRLAWFGIASFAVQWVALISLGLLHLARRRLARAGPVTVAQVALGALLLGTWLVMGLAWIGLRNYLTPPDGWPWLGLQATAISLAVGLLGLAAFQNHWRNRQLAVQAKQAQLEALQARIQPHFLFNTLNTCAALVHARPQQAERLLLDLSDLFRAALAGPSQVPLAEELDLARRYLEIESLRFGPRLDVVWNLPDQLPEVLLPTLTLQPLVENAIKHGIEPNRDGGRVTVSLRTGPGTLCIEVRNPLAPAGTRTNGHGIGLDAVRSRLLAATRGEGRVDTRIADGEHIAILTLPRNA